MTKYDIYVSLPVRPESLNEAIPIDAHALTHGGYIMMEAELETSRDMIRRLRQLGSACYLVPTAYRTPKITVEQARAAALERWQEIATERPRLSPLDAGSDDLLWWKFSAEDAEAIEHDIVPGRVTIAVDKLTGRLRTPEELKKWLDLNRV